MNAKESEYKELKLAESLYKLKVSPEYGTYVGLINDLIADKAAKLEDISKDELEKLQGEIKAYRYLLGLVNVYTQRFEGKRKPRIQQPIGDIESDEPSV